MSSSSDQDSFLVPSPPPSPPSPNRRRSRRGRSGSNNAAQREQQEEVVEEQMEADDEGDDVAAEAAGAGETSKSESTTLNCQLVGIELFNFKSYRGHHIVGPFSNLTAIVGANGSGKSNLLDAISFALCVRSSKARVRNLGELVSLRRKVGAAESDDEDGGSQDGGGSECRLESGLQAFVKLVLRSREVDPVSKEKVEYGIQRGILPNKTSQFAVNGSIVSQSEYKGVLARLGLDANSKIFLLFQGTIDALVTKNSEKLTKVIEEISGSGAYAAQYNKLKKAIDKKIALLQQNKSEKMSIMKSRNFIKNMLKNQELNVNIGKDIETIKSQLTLLELHKNASELEEARERLELNENAIIEADLEIDELERTKAEAKTAVEVAAREMATLEREYRQASLSLESNERAQLQTLERKLKATSKRLELAKKSVSDLEKKKRYFLEETEKVRETVAQLDAQIEELNGRLDEARSQGELQLSQDSRDEFIRLKQTLERRLASLDGYEAADLTERKIAMTQTMLKGAERDAAYNESERASLAAKTELKRRAIASLQEDMKVLEGQLALTQAEAGEATEAREGAVNEAKKVGERLKESLASFNSKSASFVLSKRKRQERARVEHLMAAYKGRVYGRFGDLLKPTHKKYNKAYATVANQYMNNVLVDSFATVQEIMAQEARSAYESLKLMPLNIVKLPNSGSTDVSALREIVKNISGDSSCQLLYDLIRRPTSVPGVEKALYQAVGNVVVTPNREMASLIVNRVAQENGGAQKCRAISLECNTFYKNRVEIEAWVGGTSRGGDAFHDEDELLAAETRIERLEGQFATAKQALIKATLAQELATAKVDRCQMQLKIKQLHIADLEDDIKNENAKEALLVRKAAVHAKIIEKLNGKLNECKTALEAYTAAVAQEEADIFGPFLAANQSSSVAHFEARYYNDARQELKEVARLEREREELASKIVDSEELAVLEANLALFTKKAAEEEANLGKLREEVEAARESLRVKTSQVEAAHDQVTAMGEERKMAVGRVKTVTSELEAAYKRRSERKHGALSGAQAIRRLLKARFELFRTAYVEDVSLSVDKKQFAAIFAQQTEESGRDESFLEDAAALKVDYGAISELIEEVEGGEEEANDMEGKIKRFADKFMKLKEKLVELEEELTKVTIADDVDLTQEQRELDRKLSALSKTISTLESELFEHKSEFNAVMTARQNLFSSFLEAVSARLDVVYKDITGSKSAQAFLVPKDSEEGYLDGLHYSCIAPGKGFQEMQLMSGGERCLAAFAFILAVYVNRLPCFFVMDELDASLDNANIDRLISYVRKESLQTQFIFITHSARVYTQMNSLIGVTKKVEQDEASRQHPDYTTSQTISLDLSKCDF